MDITMSASKGKKEINEIVKHSELSSDDESYSHYSTEDDSDEAVERIFGLSELSSDEDNSENDSENEEYSTSEDDEDEELESSDDDVPVQRMKRKPVVGRQQTPARKATPPLIEDKVVEDKIEEKKIEQKPDLMEKRVLRKIVVKPTAKREIVED